MPERVRIAVDGVAVEARRGETLLVALWNAGVRVLGTSVSGEPRSALCGMGTCFECRVTVDGEPNRRACLTLVRDGLEVRTRE